MLYFADLIVYLDGHVALASEGEEDYSRAEDRKEKMFGP